MDIPTYLLAKKAGGGGSDLDWQAIGYSGMPQEIIDGYNYAKYIQENWDDNNSKLYEFNEVLICPVISLGNRKSMLSFASSCSKLITLPLLDTSNIEDMGSCFADCGALTTLPLLNTSNVKAMNTMFYNCYKLKNVPLLNTEKVTNFKSMVSGTRSLTDESLDNILQMCINASSYTGTKKLTTLGFSTTYYPDSRIQALPHYQDFIDAGWTIR